MGIMVFPVMMTTTKDKGFSKMTRYTLYYGISGYGIGRFKQTWPLPDTREGRRQFVARAWGVDPSQVTIYEYQCNNEKYFR